MNEDKATRYNRLKRRVSLLSLAWNVLLLAALGFTPASRALRHLAASLAAAGATAPLTLIVYVVVLSVIAEAGSLPIAYYGGFLLERHYGLSNEGFGAWLKDQAKGLALGLVLGSAAASLLYFFIRLSPDSWWLPAGAAFALVIVGLANVAPVLLLPLF